MRMFALALLALGLLLPNFVLAEEIFLNEADLKILASEFIKAGGELPKDEKQLEALTQTLVQDYVSQATSIGVQSFLKDIGWDENETETVATLLINHRLKQPGQLGFRFVYHVGALLKGKAQKEHAVVLVDYVVGENGKATADILKIETPREYRRVLTKSEVEEVQKLATADLPALRKQQESFDEAARTENVEHNLNVLQEALVLDNQQLLALTENFLGKNQIAETPRLPKLEEQVRVLSAFKYQLENMFAILVKSEPGVIDAQTELEKAFIFGGFRTVEPKSGYRFSKALVTLVSFTKRGKIFYQLVQVQVSVCATNQFIETTVIPLPAADAHRFTLSPEELKKLKAPVVIPKPVPKKPAPPRRQRLAEILIEENNKVGF